MREKCKQGTFSNMLRRLKNVEKVKGKIRETGSECKHFTYFSVRPREKIDQAARQMCIDRVEFSHLLVLGRIHLGTAWNRFVCDLWAGGNSLLKDLSQNQGKFADLGHVKLALNSEVFRKKFNPISVCDFVLRETKSNVITWSKIDAVAKKALQLNEVLLKNNSTYPSSSIINQCCVYNTQ